MSFTVGLKDAMHVVFPNFGCKVLVRENYGVYAQDGSKHTCSQNNTTYKNLQNEMQITFVVCFVVVSLVNF